MEGLKEELEDKPGGGGQAMNVEVTVNGVAHAVDVEPRLLLVHFLRQTLGLTGTHVGCDTTSCGACTVRLDGADQVVHLLRGAGKRP